ncbi:MAG: hypothetical protein SFY66_19855 [Oculatellaceae cyanobacterium bins.114]|nr:hypothetical protein [Oculatellaceae cyanobacterium bins.114]
MARANKNYALADELRSQALELGWQLIDSSEGTKAIALIKKFGWRDDWYKQYFYTVRRNELTRTWCDTFVRKNGSKTAIVGGWIEEGWQEGDRP